MNVETIEGISRACCDLGAVSIYTDGQGFFGGARGVVVIAVGNERGDTSSNPGRD